MEEKKQNIITINGEEITLKPGMKAIIAFERIMKKPFEIKTTTDMLFYIYSAMLAGTPSMKLGFDELLDAIDATPGLLKQLQDAVMPRTAAEKVIQLSNDGGTEPKKD